MLSELYWVEPSLLCIQSGVDEVIDKSLLLKELFVVQEVNARENPFEESPPFELFICVHQSLLIFFAHVAWDVYSWGSVYHCFLINVLDNLELDLPVCRRLH